MQDTMGLIFTYKYEEDLKTLTQVRSIASIPFGGRYRIIDFLISSMDYEIDLFFADGSCRFRKRVGSVQKTGWTLYSAAIFRL